MTTDTRVGPAPTRDFDSNPPTADELGRAWDALRAGRFRAPSTGVSTARVAYGPGAPAELSAAAMTAVPGPVVLVVGAHGWSGASTTALLLAEAAARTGRSVRLVDAAEPATSGLIGAAVTEHGRDRSGHWRRGTRPVRTNTGQPGQIRLQRLNQPAGTPLAIPAAAARDDTGETGDSPGDGAMPMTVVDAGWSLPELLRLAHDEAGRGHWLAQLLACCPVVLTARAAVPAVQRAGVAADQLRALRTDSPAAPVLLALIGSHRLPRLLGDVLDATLPAFSAQGRVVLQPTLRDFAVQGITSTDLPRQLVPAGARLLQMADPHPGQLNHSASKRRRRGER